METPCARTGRPQRFAAEAGLVHLHFQLPQLDRLRHTIVGFLGHPVGLGRPRSTHQVIPRAQAPTATEVGRALLMQTCQRRAVTTDAQRAALGITVPDAQPTPVGPPTTAPVVSVESPQRLRQVFQFTRTQAEEAAAPNPRAFAEPKFGPRSADRHPPARPISTSSPKTRERRTPSTSTPPTAAKPCTTGCAGSPRAATPALGALEQPGQRHRVGVAGEALTPNPRREGRGAGVRAALGCGRIMH